MTRTTDSAAHLTSDTARKLVRIRRRTLLAGLGATVTQRAFGQPVAPGRSPLGAPHVPHIDVHVHLVGGPQKVFAEAVDACVAEMGEFSITKAVVMSPPQAPPGVFDWSDFINDIRRYGDHFAFLAGGGILNPMLHAHRDPASVTRDVERQFIAIANRALDQGAAGFGEIAVLHLSLVDRHPFEEVSCTHPLLLALAAVASERKVVIDLHMDPVAADSMRTPAALSVPPNPPTLAGNIDGFERLLSGAPEAKIAWAHGGSDFTGNLTAALVMRLMNSHPNLFMSLRPIPPQAAIINTQRFHNLILTPSGIDPDWLALLQKHADRFVMGSDAFFVSSSANPNGAAAALSRGNQGRLSAAGALLSQLPSDLAVKIATANPQRIYGI